MQNNDQKGSLKDTFSEFGAAPTDGLWNAISEQLDDKKKRRFAFWWWSTGLAAVLVAGFMIWNGNQPEGTNSPNKKASAQVAAESNSNQNHSTKGGILATAADSLGKNVPFTFVWDPSMFQISFPFMNGQYPFCNSIYSPHTWDISTSPYPSGYPPVLLPFDAVFPDTNADSVKTEDLLAAQTDSSEPVPTDTIIRTREVQQLLLRVIPRKWEVGLFVGRSQAITQSYPLIHGVGGSTPPSMAMNPAVETRYSWDVDLTVSRHLRHNWRLGSGAHFGLLESGKIAETSNYQSGKISYASLGVPLSIGREFRLHGRRVYITPIAGFRYDYAFRKTEEYTWQPDISSISSADGAQDYTKTTGTAHLHLVSGFTAAEVSFRLRHNFAIVAKPMMQFYVYGKTDEATPNTFRKAWFSGAIGVTKRF